MGLFFDSKADTCIFVQILVPSRGLSRLLGSVRGCWFVRFYLKSYLPMRFRSLSESFFEFLLSCKNLTPLTRMVHSIKTGSLKASGRNSVALLPKPPSTCKNENFWLRYRYLLYSFRLLIKPSFSQNRVLWNYQACIACISICQVLLWLMVLPPQLWLLFKRNVRPKSKLQESLLKSLTWHILRT